MSPVPCIVVECLDKRVDPSRKGETDHGVAKSSRLIAWSEGARRRWRRGVLFSLLLLLRKKNSSKFLSRDVCVRAGGVIVLAVAKSSKVIRASEEGERLSQRGVLFSLAMLLREGEGVHRPNS